MEGHLPQLIAIPKTLGEIKIKLAANQSHHGLQLACQSIKNRRAPHVASILLVGQTGSGKSSTVNSLFDSNELELAEVGDGESCTSDIVEYEVDIPMKDIGVKNSVLRVIDTPGFGDTRSPDLDAQLVATLSKYFNEQQDLKNRVPNVVLIFTRFDETRYAGENSTFVRMLKGLESLQDKIFDTQNMNVILCCTHYASVKKAIRENPTARCDDFANIVTQFTSLPRPTVVLAENNTDEMTRGPNGYYKLENGEDYPYNLFQAIQNMTTKAGDPMGENIFRSAFMDLSKFETKKKRITKLLPKSNRVVTSSSQVIERIRYKLDATEINNYLQEAWDTLSPPSLRTDYPSTLVNVQRVFEKNNIRRLGDVPTDKLGILKLMTEILQNPAVPHLLATSVALNIPKLDIALTTGQGYSLTTLDVISKSIFIKLTEYEVSSLGYLVPKGIKVELSNDTTDICEIYTTRTDYISSRLKALNIDVSTKANVRAIGLDASASGGYNILESDSVSSETISFNVLREQRLFCLTLEDNIPLSTDFKGAVKDLPPFNEKKLDIVQNYKSFFALYGTHVVTSCFGGGALDIRISVKNSKNAKDVKDTKEIANKVKAEFMNKFGADCQHGKQDSYEYETNRKSSESKFSANLRGGDTKYHTINLGEIHASKRNEVYQGWIGSLMTCPAMLKTKMNLVSISFYAKSVSEEAANGINLAIKHLFEANAEYKLPKPPVSVPRSEVLAPNSSKSCCLKKGTRIHMADGSTKSVEDIVPGDLVLDVQLRSARVIGANYVLLGQSKFYGFGNCGFFTRDHLFHTNEHLLVASLHSLMVNNPFMDMMDVQEMIGTFSILEYDETGIHPVEVSLVMDEEDYDPLTRIYYLLVDSETGTYIANNYVCRHELPPFKDLPQTLYCLQRIIACDAVRNFVVGKLMSPTLYSKIERMANHLGRKLREWKSAGKFHITIGHNALEMQSGIPLDALAEIIGNTCWATVGMLVYARCGPLLKNLTDESGENCPHLIVNSVVTEIDDFIRNNNF